VLNPEPVLLLPPELDLLKVFQSRRQVAQLSPHHAVFMGQLFDLFLQKVHVIHDSPVSIVHVKQRLNAVILFIEEVDLVLQLLHVPLVDFVLVLHVNLVDILTALVELAQAQNFVVSDLEGSSHGFHLFFEPEVLLNQLLILVSKFIGSLVGPTQLIRPFLVLHGGTAACRGVLEALISFAIFKVVLSAAVVRCQVLTDLEALSGSPEDVVEISI